MSLICKSNFELWRTHTLTSLEDYIPVYFQACMGASPIHSSVNTFPTALTIPFSAVTSGVVIKVTGKYRPSNYAGWVLMMIGFGLMTRLKADASVAQWVCFQGIAAAGVGIVWTGIVFPVLAPISLNRIAAALGFFNFSRTFAQVRLSHYACSCANIAYPYAALCRRGV